MKYGPKPSPKLGLFDKIEMIRHLTRSSWTNQKERARTNLKHEKIEILGRFFGPVPRKKDFPVFFVPETLEDFSKNLEFQWNR